MRTPTSSAPSCRYCRYYTPEGRRGGHCQQLNVAVQSAWKACSLAMPPFAPAWENLEGIMVWQQKTLAVLQEPLLAGCGVAEEIREIADPVPSCSDRPSGGAVRWA